MVLKVSADGDSFESAAVISAIQYATMMKTRGINVVALIASYGGDDYSSTARSAMQAAGHASIVFCAAAGNSTNNNDTLPSCPASYRLPNMIVVAASDQNDALAGFSDYGATSVDLFAPGVNVLFCSPAAQPGNNTYVQQSTNVVSGNSRTHSGTTSSNGISGAVYFCGLGYPTNFPVAITGCSVRPTCWPALTPSSKPTLSPRRRSSRPPMRHPLAPIAPSTGFNSSRDVNERHEPSSPRTRSLTGKKK